MSRSLLLQILNKAIYKRDTYMHMYDFMIHNEIQYRSIHQFVLSQIILLSKTGSQITAFVERFR